MEASRCSGIPCKNIKRWATQGVLRKKGGGRRRYSPEMELSTYNWLCETYPRDSIVEMEKIQNYALGESDDESFKASRGWVLKFIQRFQLRDRFEIV